MAPRPPQKDYDEFWDRLSERLIVNDKPQRRLDVVATVLFWAAVIALVLLAFAIATGALV